MANLLLIALGFLLIIIGLILVLAARPGGEVKGGGIVLLGPLPIILGGKGVKVIVAFMALLLIFFLLAGVIMGGR